ncbi:electron transfer flavoprotein subunit alpha/FixB family protein [Clostridium sp. D33t1_170424_F3]|uniref:electron transfer flavoprotein subunit alpha/FixB family protein n=1 Tax=Clostridium sp. D33t1_170424_F3 TaxID=2787099 RepID=UPI0018A90836|nr:electron transfer flavoprotein subunit alpha/FixB family protein [Clostridium sp. D33t1_170424_F3]
MNIQDYQGVFVFIQQVDNKITGVSYELLGKAKELAADLGTEVTAVLLGYQVEELCPKLARYGADKVVLVDDKALEPYTTEPYTHTMYNVIEKYKPAVVLYGATAIGRDLAPRVSARVHTGLTADCTKLEIDPENKNLKMTRPAFGGNIMATIVCPEHRPQMATVRPGVMQKIKPVDGASCPVEAFNPGFEPNNKNVEVLEVIKKVSDKIDIQDAKILISGGRGVGCPENFKLLQDLADVIGGEVSASRACVDAGWAEKDVQVGQTGKTVRPNLYIACGISGAIQHLAGMEDSDVIIAINKDENAPIFEVADYGIVGDVAKVLPIFTEKLKEELALRNA